jgi:transcriptional regulator with XRE-family HTH domain
MMEWYEFVRRAQWRNSQDVKRDFAAASFVANKRIVFNVGRNKYRVVVVALFAPAPCTSASWALDRLEKDPKDLEVVLKCSRTRVWEILNRKRPLTLAQIRLLVSELGIPADRLVGEYDLDQPVQQLLTQTANQPSRATKRVAEDRTVRAASPRRAAAVAKKSSSRGASPRA